MDSPPVGQFHVFSLLQFLYLRIHLTFIKAPLRARYHLRDGDRMWSKTHFLQVLMFTGGDNTETDTKSGIHSKKSLSSKSSFIKISSSREQLQLDTKGLLFVSWCGEGLMDVNNRLGIPDIPSTVVHMV